MRRTWSAVVVASVLPSATVWLRIAWLQTLRALTPSPPSFGLIGCSRTSGSHEQPASAWPAAGARRDQVHGQYTRRQHSNAAVAPNPWVARSAAAQQCGNLATARPGTSPSQQADSHVLVPRPFPFLLLVTLAVLLALLHATLASHKAKANSRGVSTLHEFTAQCSAPANIQANQPPNATAVDLCLLGTSGG